MERSNLILVIFWLPMLFMFFFWLQWHWPKGVYLLYRFLLLAYTMTVLVLSIVYFDHNKQATWLVFLTHWSYSMLTAHLLVATVISLVHVLHDSSGIRIAVNRGDRGIISQRMSKPFYMKLSWLLFVIASGSAFMVTCIYFGAVFPQRGVGYLNVEDINLHIMNSVVIILEFIIAALPVRLLHGVYLFVFGLMYIVFSVIYWSFDHRRVIYPHVLDWNFPGRTMIYMLLVGFVFIPLLQSFLFGLYSLRRFIYRRIHFRRSTGVHYSG